MSLNFHEMNAKWADQLLHSITQSTISISTLNFYAVRFIQWLKGMFHFRLSSFTT